jgi:hypothetical protein
MCIFTQLLNPMKRLYLLVLFLSFWTITAAQVFTPLKDHPPGLIHAASAWVDDGSGKLNLLTTGDFTSGTRTTVKTVYMKQSGADRFSSSSVGLPDVTLGAVKSADLNRNGRSDIVLMGQNAAGRYVSGIYFAQADGSFRRSEANLPALIDGSIDIADYNRDGMPDILISGRDENARPVTKLFRNDNGRFSEVTTTLPGIMRGQAVFGDINNDGYPDILLCGQTVSGPLTRLYLNNQGSFMAMTNLFTALRNSAAAITDFDNDKWNDIIISGENRSGKPTLVIYKNLQNNIFSEVSTSGIRPLMNCRIEIADFNVDGLNDFVITGESLERPYTTVYQNMGNFRFNDIMAGIPGVSNGHAVWGDYDGDGDPDLYVTGIDICYNLIGQIYRNNTNPDVERDEPAGIFIESPIVDYSQGPYYYFLFSSCFCDPDNSGTKKYHMFVSNIHREERDFDLNYKYNEILINRFPNWGPADRSHRTSNAFLTRNEAEEARKGVIESYTADGYKVHYFNW